MKVMPINEESFLVSFENDISVELHLKVKFYKNYLETNMDTIDVLTGYNSILVTYDYNQYDFDDFRKCLESVQYKKISKDEKKKIIYIPVCYEDIYALDISRVADLNKMTIDEVIIKHTEGEYLVHMIGFTPGFPYLGGMNQEIATARLDAPRIKIEAGSVGIGGKQTGIYPAATPGGWNIIGRTPVKLFDINKEAPSLLKMGDYIKFQSISLKEYEAISNKIKNDNYQLKIEVIS